MIFNFATPGKFNFVTVGDVWLNVLPPFDRFDANAIRGFMLPCTL